MTREVRQDHIGPVCDACGRRANAQLKCFHRFCMDCIHAHAPVRSCWLCRKVVTK
jgi:hypothetical protein